MLIRSYTPTRPVKRSEEDGTFDLVVKTYFPDKRQPGGAMSNILDCMPIGEEIEIRGPTGEISYHGNGKFMIEGKEKDFSKVSLILGGSGITPGYALIARILGDEDDKTQLRVVDANKSEKDILLKEQMEDYAKEHREQFKVCHVLSHPSAEWKGVKGHVNEDIIKEHAFAPDGGKNSVEFLCGPPAMIQKVGFFIYHFVFLLYESAEHTSLPRVPLCLWDLTPRLQAPSATSRVNYANLITRLRCRHSRTGVM